MEPTVAGRLEEEGPLLLDRPDSPAQIRAEVWRIAWPSVLTFSLMTTNSILDRVFVGQLGRDALAAVGFGGLVMFLLVSLSMAITVGTTALVARFTGAKEPEEASRATGQSIALGALTGLVCMALIYAALEPLLSVVGLKGGARDQCRAFLRVAFLGSVPMMLVGVISSAYRGLGDTRTPLKVMICANLVHITGDWTLMLGHGGPRLGLVGGGIALVSSNVVALAAYLWLLARSPLAAALSRRHLALTLEWARRVMRIGIPAAVTALIRSTSMMGFTGILTRTPQGMNAVAALPIGMTAESIAFMPGLGYSIAASALVGQALGARRPDRAERYGWAATWQGVAIMSVMGTAFFVWAEPFARLFTRDPAVLPLAVSYLRIMAISEPFLAFGMILTGGLQGAGDTIRPAVLTALSFWGIRLPAAYVLALVLDMQTAGAWVAMSGTTIVGGLLTILLFRSDKWKRVKV